MSDIKCTVVDDDLMSLRLMESLIDKTDFLDLIDISSDSIEASRLLRENPVELIFLDIEMPQMNGLELIQTLEYSPEVILISSKKEYVEDAFDLEVTDYLIKPINNYARFLKAVNRARQNINQKIGKAEPSNLFIKVDSLFLNFKLEDIEWIKAYGDFVKIHTEKKVYTVLSKLQTIYDKLPDGDFVRVHRSYIVRVDKIYNIDAQANNLQVGKRIIPISRSYRSHMMAKIATL